MENGKWKDFKNGAAGVFRWFGDEIAAYEKMEAEKNNKNVYELLNKLIEDTPAGSLGLLCCHILLAQLLLTGMRMQEVQ